MNEYYQDAGRFVRRAAARIEDRASDEDLAEGILHLALGMERFLKGLLYDINPVYVYTSPEFKHTAPILYNDRLRPGYSQSKQIASNPNDDVITFRSSLHRAKLCSESIEKHSSLLFSLSNMRDILAHRPMSELDTGKARSMATRDMYVLVSDCSTEVGHDLEHYLGPHSDRLRTLSEEIREQEAFEARMQAILAEHKAIWEAREEEEATSRRARFRTLQKRGKIGQNRFYDTVECPACGNDALVAVEADFDLIDRRAVFMGVFADHLKCYYCDLELDSYEELDYVNIDNLLQENVRDGDWAIEDGDETSAEDMVDWFRTNYEDPAQRIPYNSRDGGYQYFAGGPYDPREELGAHFPDASQEAIEAATDTLYSDSFEWVKKSDYDSL
jgi:hypothetical protein